MSEKPSEALEWLWAKMESFKDVALNSKLHKNKEILVQCSLNVWNAA